MTDTERTAHGPEATLCLVGNRRTEHGGKLGVGRAMGAGQEM